MPLKRSDLDRLSPWAKAETNRQMRDLMTCAERQHAEPVPYRRHKDLVRACLAWLHVRGCAAWQNNTGAAKFGKRFVRFGVRGGSDIIGILPGGMFLAVECKVGKDVLTADQGVFLHNVAEKNGVALVVRDEFELDRGLAGEGQSKMKAVGR